MRFHQFGISIVLLVSSWILLATANTTEFPRDPRNLSEDVEMGVHYVEDRLQELANTITSTADHFRDSIVSLSLSVQKFQKEILSKLEAEGHTLEVLFEKIEAQFEVTLEELQSEFSVPLPEEQSLRQKQRETFVSEALFKVENVVVDVASELGISREDARNSFQNVSPHIERFLLVSGVLADNHPDLVGFLIFSGITLLVPESWLLRPLLALFGFGKLGPVKGSVATWAQKNFFGAIVSEGSWFAILQAAGMKKLESSAGNGILGMISLGVGVVWNYIKHLGG